MQIVLSYEMIIFLIIFQLALSKQEAIIIYKEHWIYRQ